MDLNRYLIIQQIIMGTLMAFGGHLIFENVPTQLKKHGIYRASRIMGVAAMVIPIFSFLFFFLGLQHCNYRYATAINLSAYCIASTLIAISYNVLLGRKKGKYMLNVFFVAAVVFNISLWTSLIYGVENNLEILANQTIVAAYTLYVVLATTHIVSCIYLYHKKLSLFKSGESEFTETEIKTLGKTIYISMGLIPITMLSPAFYSYPLWLGGVFVLALVGVYIFIYINFRRLIALRIAEILPEISNEHNSSTPENQISNINSNTKLSDEITHIIKIHLNSWLTSKEFLLSDVTIEHVANKACTNRTYLSRYINAEHGCSFRTWIAQLRINESKILLKNNPELSIEDIAMKCGFTSVESFSNTFTKHEKTSPQSYR